MINWDKPIETVAGTPAKWVYVFANVNNSYRHLIVVDHSNVIAYALVDDDGQQGDGTSFIRNKPARKRKVYVNIHRTPEGYPYSFSFDDRESALTAAKGTNGLIALAVEIEVEP